MRISNHSGDLHPMHLHGHHAVVLARDGVPASGSPWWVDSLNVANGESYEVAFVADNPGIWTDHCHNLPHAAEGLVVHLMYESVTTRYLIGGATRNTPE
jgi:FtsP/CotA-like multicopper oxidase with cupredoxin domain